MREILFRGKRRDKPVWWYGSYLFLHLPDYDWTGQPRGPAGDIHYIVDKDDINYAVLPETIGQYTGHKDKNGTKIFEGDIVKRDFGEETIGVQYASVEYRDSIHGFTMNPRNDWMFTEFEDCEVIGNIHDNLVLMEVKKC